MLFTPLLPSAGPTGGDGDAWPAPTINLTKMSFANAFLAIFYVCFRGAVRVAERIMRRLSGDSARLGVVAGDGRRETLDGLFARVDEGTEKFGAGDLSSNSGMLKQKRCRAVVKKIGS